jgi:hypothetical protein
MEIGLTVVDGMTLKSLHDLLQDADRAGMPDSAVVRGSLKFLDFHPNGSRITRITVAEEAPEK